MVLPIAAAAARGAASGAARTSATRSATSKGVSARSKVAANRNRTPGGQFAPGSKDTSKEMKGIFDVMKDMKTKLFDPVKKGLAFLGKIGKTLEKASPALKQQMTILKKSFSLFLRPIGDLLARWLRPMAIWMIKFATRWYQIFGTGNAKEGSTGQLESEKEQLSIELESAILRGDTDAAGKIEDKILAIDTALQDKGFWNKIKQAGTDFLNSFVFFGKCVADGAGIVWEKISSFGKGIADGAIIAWDAIKTFGEGVANGAIIAWEAMKNFGKGVADGAIIAWESLRDFGISIGNWVGDIWNDYVVAGWKGMTSWAGDIWNDYVVAGWKGMLTWSKDIWNKYVVKGWKGMTTWAGDIWDKYVVTGWSDIKSWSQKIWDTYIAPGFKGAKKWGKDILDKAGSFFEGVGDFLGLNDANKDGKAIGGPIDKTGYYKLHSGERVLTAGEVSNSSMNSSSINITNNITIPAVINSDMDIRELAYKLAEYEETELRRRSSYL